MSKTIIVQYRNFGKLDWKVSALGFGTMRLPTIGNDPNQINEPTAIKLLRYAIDHGVNYIDTAFTYFNGNSETVLGKALQGKYRKKAKVATKMPVHHVINQADLDKYFAIQLARLQTDHIDFYLFHTLNRELWAKVKTLNIIEWAENKIAKGQISHLGFSFHDNVDVFKEIIDGYNGWDFCQIQYNYLDPKYQAGQTGLKYAADRGLAVSVMEPLAAGTLAITPPMKIQKILNSAPVKRTAAEWALSWVWNQPQVSVVLSGMATLQQVKENLQAAGKSHPNMLSGAELQLLSKAATLYHQCGYVGCTKCRYCSQCPKNIAIPEILALFNDFQVNKNKPKMQAQLKEKYKQLPQLNRADACAGCGQCEQRCPQQLPIRKLLSDANSALQS